MPALFLWPLAFLLVGPAVATGAQDILPGFDSVPDMLTELSESTHDMFGMVRKLFSGKRPWSTSNHTEQLEHALLRSFCGVDITHPNVLSCMCCTSHLLGNPAAQAALLYGSGPVKAPVWNRHREGGASSEAGWVSTWSLGGRIPGILCDRGQMLCACEDSEMGWHEEEPACQAGGVCVVTEPVEEGLGPHPGIQLNSKSSGHPDCNSMRISLGSALCEDVSVKQCEHLYRKNSNDTWQYCEVNNHAVRECAAHVVDNTEVIKLVAQAQSWAIQHIYTPDIGWPLHAQADQTLRVNETPVPAVEQIRELLKNYGIAQASN